MAVIREGTLKEGMNALDVVALGVGATVGQAIFFVVAPAAQIAGPGLLIALLLAAIPMVAFTVIYAFLGSVVPRSGSSYDWPAEFVHPFVGFIVNWLRILGNAGALQLMAVLFVSYVSDVIGVRGAPMAIALLAVFCAVNLLGVKVAATVNRVLVLVKVGALALFVLLGSSSVQPANFVPMFPAGWWGLLATVPLLSGVYMGLEVAVEVGQEIRNSASVIAKGLAVSLALTALVYFAVFFVALGVLGAPTLAASTAPILEAGHQFLGEWANVLIIVAAGTAVGTTMNATYLIFARFLMAMGRDGVLPTALARIHPTFGTPYVATLVVFGAATASFLLPSSFLFLFLTANIPVMLKYASQCWAAARLVDRHPELHKQAKFVLSRRAVKAWSSAGIGLAGVMIVAGIGADWRPYVALGAWGAVGLVYWAIRGTASLIRGV